MSFHNIDDNFVIVLTLSLMLLLFFMVHRFPLFLFGIFSFVFMLCFLWQGIPFLINLLNRPKGMELPSFHIFFIGLPVLWILGGAFMCAFAYVPRGIEWKRYFFPYRNRPFFDLTHKKNPGFTLIELLIMVAILGIFSMGVMHSWAEIVRTQHELVIRSHATEILQSEMAVLMSTTPLPAVSSNPNGFPIPIQKFTTPFQFTGNYLVESTEMSGLVKISARLCLKMNNREDRNFRLIGYRRWSMEKQP